MVVEIGDSFHSLYDWFIMRAATAKQATTIATQATLVGLVLAVEMWTSPWTVELSKNSRQVEKTILYET